MNAIPPMSLETMQLCYMDTCSKLLKMIVLGQASTMLCNLHIKLIWPKINSMITILVEKTDTIQKKKTIFKYDLLMLIINERLGFQIYGNA